MTDGTTTHFDELLARMSKIAEAVEAFPEAVQPRAFEVLVAAASGAAMPTPTPADTKSDGLPKESGTRSPRRQRDGGAATRKRSRKPRRSSSTPALVKDLDLHPQGKKSFAEFVAEKTPKTNHDRHAVAVYYLKHFAEIEHVSVDHVYTAWREVGWTLPPDFIVSLQLTASKKRYFDTSDRNDLRLRNPGVNRVEHELPEQKG